MKRILIVLVVLAIIGTGVWFYLRSKKVTTKAQAIEVISAYTGIGAAAYQSMGDSYLISRANAIKQGSETFQDGSSTYVTKTGKSA